MPEQWRDIPGYEGYYQASNRGRIRSLDRTVVDLGGRRTRQIPGRVIKGYVNAVGYRMYTLSVDGNETRFLGHQLVTAAFLGPCPDKHEVHHINGDPLDNRPQNLEYVTRKQHIRKTAEDWGRHPVARGSKCALAKLVEPQVKEIKWLLHNSSLSHRQMGKHYNVHKSTIRAIASKRTWKHIAETVKPDWY